MDTAKFVKTCGDGFGCSAVYAGERLLLYERLDREAVRALLRGLGVPYQRIQLHYVRENPVSGEPVYCCPRYRRGKVAREELLDSWEPAERGAVSALSA